MLTKGGSLLEDYLHKAKVLAFSLHGARKPMDNDDFMVCLIRCLGLEFDPNVAALNAHDIFPSVKGVISKLRDFELCLITIQNKSLVTTRFTNRHGGSTGYHVAQNGQPCGFLQRLNGYCPTEHRSQHFIGSRTPSFTRGGRVSN